MISRQVSWCLFFLMMSSILMASPVMGDIVSDVETFTGTVKDTTAWEEFLSNGNGSVTQNGAVTLLGNNGGAQVDYTTKTFRLAVGQWVSVEVTPTSAGTFGQVGLCLTNNSQGVTARTFDDSAYAGLYWANADNAIQTISGGIDLVAGDHPLNTRYIYRVEWSSNNVFTYRVYNAAGVELGSYRQPVSGGPTPPTMFISLISTSANTIFDNVRVGSIGGSNVDTFVGTTKDEGAWEGYLSTANGSINQNDALTIQGISGGGAQADYTTKTLQVAVGQSVSVEVTPTAVGTYGQVGLVLTNNSQGLSARTFNDSNYFGIYWANADNAVQTLSGGVDLISSDHPLNTRYVYRIDRVSATQATYTVFGDNGAKLGSVTQSVGSASPLYVSLVSTSADTVFHNVRVGPISGFVDKDVKVISYGQFVPSPSFVQSNIGTMEQTAFQGFGMDLHQNGKSWDTTAFKLGWNSWGGTAWTLSTYLTDYNLYLNTAFSKFDNNLQPFLTKPGNIDMFDDTAYSVMISNARLVSSIIKNNAPVGIVFDPEDYSSNVFCYNTQPQKANHTFAEYKVKAKQRGQEFMQALYYESGTPDLNILMLYGYSVATAVNETDTYGLMPSFINGMLAGARTNDRIYDGYEYSYPYKTKLDFLGGYRLMHTVNKFNGLTDSAAEYDAHYRAGFATWIDYNQAVLGWDPNNPANNFYTPTQFYRSLQWAVNYSDKYVWVYNQQARWFDYPTASNIQQVYRDALARLRKKGKLDAFLGAMKGLGAWEQHVSAGIADVRIVQNDNLEIDGQNPSVANLDYTTTALTLGVGEKVNVEITPMSSGGSAVAGVVLTNDSGGTSGGTLSDSHFVGIVWEDNQNTIRATTNSGSTTILAQDHGIGTTLIYEIERTSSTQAKVRVYDAYYQLQGTEQTLGLNGVPDELYISLISNSGKVRFEDVWIQTTPEQGQAVAGPFLQGVTLNDGHAQRSKVASLSVSFDQPVVCNPDAFRLAQRSGPSVMASAANPSGDGRTHVVTFPGAGQPAGSLPDGIYDLTIAAGRVFLANGVSLKTDISFTFHRLFGDSDGDKDVDGVDSLRFRAAMNTNAASSNYRGYFDGDSDNDIDAADSLRFRQNLNKVLIY